MASVLVPTSAFTLLFFLISLTPTTVTSAVLDVNGKFVTNGVGKYYMVPFDNKLGGGPITWADNTNSCPLYVIRQALIPDTRYSPITLYSPYMSTFIPEGPISIKFNDVDTPCDKPLWWFIKPTLDMEAHFSDLAAGKSDVSSFALVIEDAKIEGSHVYQLMYCHYKKENDRECLYVVEKPDNSNRLGVIYGIPNGLKPFQFELVEATFPSQAREI